ncbi:RADS2 nonreducing polyketide synthase [Zopfia rhizophila CBS 207.26]|uniref:RADS2 nonreducing polyketide synthase n=1 Tax=Zopfia rhizophila CBS 207.26 TaxID=1314779 RepID=A0A6A6DQX7_9PEZI|nr:RADS2 nonreducing polyketide synthase [Zopfia rhizophila CBS 207.26]
MTSSHSTQTILLFGDQVDSPIANLDAIYTHASTTPWLSTYLSSLTSAIQSEIRTINLDLTLQSSLGRFSSLQELADRYRHTPDTLGMAQCLLLHTVRSATLLGLVRQDATLLQRDTHPQTQWLGISGGLITMSAAAVSGDFDTLAAASLQIARLFVRLCKFTSSRSRAVEDVPGGVFGWAIVGMGKDELGATLERFQKAMNVPMLKRARVGVTGAGWSTVIGAPSVCEMFVKQCKEVRGVAKNALGIYALQHTIKMTEEELAFIVGADRDWLDREVASPSMALWGMDEPLQEHGSWGDMLRAICSQVLSRPLDIPEAVGKLTATLDGEQALRLVQVGSTSHALYVLSTIKSPKRQAILHDGHSLLTAHDTTTSTIRGKVAIVGMAGRGPGSDNYEELWEHIMAKADLCTEVPKDRFDIDEFYCPEHGKERKCSMTTRYGCFMKNPGHFDARFFHISPREAMLMDPGHRHFLMSTYEALEMAGYSDGATRAVDPDRIATFYGQVTDDWHDQSHPTLGCDAYTLQGVQRAFGSGRVAWQFGWEGPTYSLDSACASTTSGIHMACMSLLANDIDMAIAGAANILSYPHSFGCLSKAGVLSDTGNCKTYRDDADGYCRADFVGAVVLKRLGDAIAHNDNILAVVSGTGRNHSGNAPSITTSDAGAQERLFRKVLRNAQVSPDDISYIEMHGTGTQTGDPAEMNAVANTFRHRKRALGPIPVGSSKANFGHSEGAAGLVSLLKCINMFQKDTIPPQAGMPHALNPKFRPLNEWNITIPSEPTEYKKNQGRQPRRILLNNFDAAGGNACMVVEDFPAVEKKATDARPIHVVVTSARTQASHAKNKRQLLEWLRASPNAALADIAYTTTARRMHHPIRSSYTASTTEELISKLEASSNEPEAKPSSSSPVVWVFTGQGSHYAGMGSELYRTSPVFRETIEACANICREYNFPAFLDLIVDRGGSRDILASKSTVQTQLAVLSLEIGLAAFWRSIGIHPGMVMGHSLGEYAALYVAGVLSLADVLYLVGRRAMLLLERCEADAFAMLTISMPADAAREMLATKSQYGSCSVACMNSPSATVISGSSEDIVRLQKDIQGPSKALAVPYGFHSFQMDQVLAEFANIGASVRYSEPKLPVASTLLGAIVDSSGTFNARYLAQQTRQPVDFVGAIHAVKSKYADPKVLSTLKKAGEDWVSISATLAKAYEYGLSIDWLALHQPYQESLKMVTLPSYSWDMKDYWITYSDANKLETTASSRMAEPSVITSCAQYVVQERASAKSLGVTMGASLAEPGFSRVLNGHVMQNEAICAGSVFCEAAFAAAIYLLKSHNRKEDAQLTKLGLRNPVMTRPLTNKLVGSNGQLLTTVVIDKASPNDLQVSWKASPSGPGPSFDLGSCILAVSSSAEDLQSGWDRLAYYIKTRADEIVRAAKDDNGHRFKPDIFYSLFSSTVEYDPKYRCIQAAFVSDDFSEAVAEVVLQNDPSDARFVASPYWGEALVHLAGFIVNANPSNQHASARTCFINSGFQSFDQTVHFQAGQKYLSYVRATDASKDARTLDVFVFNSASKLVAQCLGLSFHQIPKATLAQVLSGGPKPKPSAPPIRDAPRSEIEETPKEISIPSQMVEEPENPGSKPGVFEAILEIIAEETGMELAELTDDVAIGDVGVDSIMAIEVAAKVSSATGLEVLPSFVFEYPSIGDLRREYAATPPSTASGHTTRQDSSDRSDSESSLSSIEGFQVVSNEPKPKVVAPSAAKEGQEVQVKAAKVLPATIIDESSPAPSVKVTLLKGGSRANPQAPFYMIADGTGSIATYLHLPGALRSTMPIYGINSPFLRCPTRFTTEVGIPGAAKYIVDALLQKHPNGMPIWLGGFSGGAMLAYEVARQLTSLGHTIEGLLLMDMISPRESHVVDDGAVGLAMFNAISGSDDSGVWDTSYATQAHLRALFAAVAAYNPSLPSPNAFPAKRAAVVWAQRGMIDRCSHSQRLMDMLVERSIPTERYDGFMEDANLGSVMWSLPHKAEADLGPNGWEKHLGKDVLCMSVEADHLEMPTPDFAHLMAGAMDKALEHFRS